jgi:RNA polymerase sigma-70 factor (ECF subfamily)
MRAPARRRASAADAEDVVQDVLLRVFRNTSSLREEERFGAWLATLVRNAVADQLRTRQRHPLPPAGASDRLETPAVAADDSGDSDRIRVLAALRPFAERLPALYRDVIILSEFEDVPHAQIADRLDISISGVKSRVQRGREQLRKMLVDCCEISLDARHAIIDCVPKSATAAASCCTPSAPAVSLKRP